MGDITKFSCTHSIMTYVRMVGKKRYDSLRAVTYVRTSKIYRPQIFITQIVVQLSFLQRQIKAFLIKLYDVIRTEYIECGSTNVHASASKFSQPSGTC